jgi:hypothetical protein
MKIIITESQYETLFLNLPQFLKRRITMEDLEWFDKNVNRFIITTPPVNEFKDFSDYIIGDLLHEFISERKGDEIDTYYDEDYDEHLWDETSRNKVMDMYWELKPFLEKRYKDRLYLNWERKKQI